MQDYTKLRLRLTKQIVVFMRESLQSCNELVEGVTDALDEDTLVIK